MKDNEKKYWPLLSKYLKPQRGQVIVLGILMLASIGLQLIIPQILRFFIDAAREGEALDILLRCAGVFMAVAIFQQIVSIGSVYISQNIGWTATNKLRSDLASHCLKLDMTFHKKHRTGELIERIDGDVTDMFNFFSNLLVECLSHLVLVLGVLVFLFIEDWRIGIAMTLFVVIALLVMGGIRSFAIPRHRTHRESITEFYGFLGETLENTEDIRSNGAEEKIYSKFRKILRQWLPRSLRASMANMSMWTSTLAIFALGNSMAFGIGGVLWSRGIITVGAVYLVFHYTEMLSMPLRQIQRQLADLQKAGASIGRIEEFLQILPKIVDGKGQNLSSGALSLEIENMNFEYEESMPVLKEISLRLEPGKVLGVLGRTGSGKTTLARLLNRFYDIPKGDILLNGQKISTIPLKSLRSSIAFVTQDVQLFNASVRDNLTFFNPDISDENIRKALRDMGLEGWINSLPNGLDTMLSSDGGGLSAGEAQLLAFVRVFLKNPGLVILDEASSRLDPVTEQLMEGAINKLFEGRTAIIIAHRLQTIERAEEILILDNGRICEHGRRLELIEDKQSHFSQLLRTGIKEVLA